MTIFANQLKTEIFYPDSDGKPIAESDPARDYLIYGVESLDIYFQQAVIGKNRLDLTVDPPPDLALETDLTSKTELDA